MKQHMDFMLFYVKYKAIYTLREERELQRIVLSCRGSDMVIKIKEHTILQCHLQLY